MSATKRPRFDVDALRERAGEKTFARGDAYHRDDRVEILLSNPSACWRKSRARKITARR